MSRTILSLQRRTVVAVSRGNLRALILDAFDRVPDGTVINIQLEVAPNQRTQQQSRYYWGVVLPTIVRALDDSYTADELHYQLFGPAYWPSGKTRFNPLTRQREAIPRETKKMEAREFWDTVVEPVCKWAAEQGIEIPLPPPGDIPPNP